MRLTQILLAVAIAFSTLCAKPTNVFSQEFFCANEARPAFYATRDPELKWTAEKLRETGSTPGDLRIAVEFINPTRDEVNRVMNVAKRWATSDAAAGITLVFDSPAKAHIRIRFSDKHPRSLLGVSALTEDADPDTTERETMLLPHLNKLTDQVILHEFGHALGLEHEHLNPNVNFVWKESEVLKDHWDTPWCPRELGKTACEQKIKDQITRKRPNDHACPGSPRFDEKSIMMYPIYTRWLKNGRDYPENTTISDEDKKCVQNLYPAKQNGITTITRTDPYRVIYRECLREGWYTCKKISIIENNSHFFEFKSYGESWGNLTWTWKKIANDEFSLIEVRSALYRQTFSCNGSIYKNEKYFEGYLDWPEPCCGDAYIRIGEQCPR